MLLFSGAARGQPPAMLAALVEHESCISLTHRGCWNPASRLKSAREEGAGLGQIARAHRADGTVRFDASAEMVERHPALADWRWSNVYQRPDLQLAVVVLKSRDNYMYFMRFTRLPIDAFQFGDAGYNGGNGGVQKERIACGLEQGCDLRVWMGHVCLHCMKSKAALYGQRSACDINRHHVLDVTVARWPKYRGLV